MTVSSFGLHFIVVRRLFAGLLSYRREPFTAVSPGCSEGAVPNPTLRLRIEQLAVSQLSTIVELNLPELIGHGTFYIRYALVSFNG